jgi:magnesium transporter
LPDHTDQLFVVDRRDVLKGALPLDRLLLNEPDIKVTSVMKSDILTLSALDDVSEAAQAFERYDLVSAPVVDSNGRLIGRLTVDEVVDVIREEGEQEALAKVGLREDEDLFASVWKSAKNRWLWLAINLGTAFFASRVIGAFEHTIATVVALATLMTIVMGIAGNSGNQTMTLMIRSIALGQVTGGNTRRLVLKELAIAAMNGLVWGGIAGLMTWWIYSRTPQGWLIGLTMLIAMTLNMLVGTLVGMLVPLMLHRYGRDPALGSSVLLTFTTDSMGVFIFLGLATLLFR